MVDVHSTASGQPVGAPLGDWTPPAWPPQRTLIGSYVQLEPVDIAGHAEGLFTAFAADTDGRNWTYLPYGPFESEAAFTAWLRDNTRAADPQFYAVRSRENGALLGLASFLRIAPSAGTIEVGHIHFSPTLQRTALATESMYLMMSHVFACGFRRYEWKCDALNAPSRRAAERLGFRFEGEWRQAAHYKGRNRDTAWFAVIDRDWPALETAFKRWLDADNFDPDGQQRVSLSALTRAAVE